MTLRSRMRDVITINTPVTGTPNDYGDDVPTWDALEVIALVQANSATEDDVDRETRTTDYLALVPATAVVDATCTVTLPDGTTCQIMGDPIVYRTPRGDHHIELALRSIDA